MKPKSTAILLFAQSGQIDARNKGIAGGARVLDTLTFQTLLKAKRTGLPCYHIGEKQQRGANFSERFSNAIHALFLQGFENLIVIGNDSPGLTSGNLLSAARSLESGKVVLGPSSDGGVYLIGFHRSLFEKSRFEALPWSTGKEFEHLRELFIEQTDNIPVVLKSQMDLDSLGDFRNWVNGIIWCGGHILRLIRGLLSGPQHFSTHGISPATLYPSKHFNKGSPSFQGATGRI